MSRITFALSCFYLIAIVYMCCPAVARESFTPSQAQNSEHGEIRVIPIERKGLWKRLDESDRRKYGEYYDYYFGEPDDAQCSQEEFWHVRGLRCVPYECPGGNQFRNMNTGECMLKSFGSAYDDPKERYNRLNR